MTKTQPNYDNPRMVRVRRLTWLMSVLTFAFLIYWSGRILTWLIPFLFQNGIQSHRWVEADVIVTFGQKAAYGLVWGVMLGLTWFTFWAALHMLKALHAGQFFEADTCKRIQRLGLALSATMVGDTILAAVTPPLLTWNNAPLVIVDGERAAGSIGYRPLRYFYDSGDIAMLLCGLGFFILGWVLAEGVHIAEENKGFV